MKKKPKSKPIQPNINVSLVLILIFSLILIGILGSKAIWRNERSSDDKLVPTPNPVISMYSKDDIFKEIQFKERQVEDSTIPELLKKELLNPNTALSKMKCMPDQIYIGRSGYKYSILQNDSQSQKEVKLNDQKMLDLISLLDNKMPKGYVLSQLFACKTEDERYIIKYNGIVTERAAQGYSTQTPVAFISQVFSDGTIQDAAYISLDNSFCRTPIQLTKDGLFYLRCDTYFGINGTGEISQSHYYKIDLKKLNHSVLSKCFNVGGSMACE